MLQVAYAFFVSGHKLYEYWNTRVFERDFLRQDTWLKMRFTDVTKFHLKEVISVEKKY